MIDFLVGLSESEIHFWLDVSKGALQRTQKEIKVLTDKKYRAKVKNTGVKMLTEPKRKKLLTRKRMEERELLERVERWEFVVNKKRNA